MSMKRDIHHRCLSTVSYRVELRDVSALTETNDTTRYRHHPEHSVDSVPVRCGG